MVTRIGLLDHVVARVPIFVAVENFRVRKAADVMKIYVSSARRVR